MTAPAPAPEPDPLNLRVVAVDFALQLKSIKSQYDRQESLDPPTADTLVADAQSIYAFLAATG